MTNAHPRARTRIRTTVPLALGALTAIALVGCSSPTPSGSTTAEDERELTVLAAASLSAPFTEIAEAFEDDHPGVSVRLSFAGSADLVDQLIAGAPADVLATADTRTMDRAQEAGIVYDPLLFASNAPVVVVPVGNPAGIKNFADLAAEDVNAVVCAPEVPCGAATDRLEDQAGVDIHRVSEERSVTDVLAKVTAGEADAGVVYATDAIAAEDAVAVVATPEAESIRNDYPIAEVADSADHALAGEFVAAVTSDPGRRTLRQSGFGAP